jgi:hypothetical protein
MSDTVTPSTISPAAVKPTAPAQAATPAAKPPEAPVKTAAEIELENTRAALERTRQDLRKKTQESIVNRRGYEEKTKTMGARLSLADQHEKFLRELKVNPLKALQPYLGEKAYERIVEAQLGGGTASAEAMQLEIEKVKEGFQDELKKRDEAAAKQAEAAREETQKAALAAARKQIASEAAALVKEAGAEYPIAVDNFGARLPQVLAQRIEAHFFSTRKVDAEGNETQPGVALTPKAALEQLENDLATLVEKGLSAAKYADRWKSKLTPAPTSGGNAPVGKPQSSAVPQQVHRSVNNGLTASTSARPDKRTDAERRAAAIAKFEELASRRA